MLLLVDTNKSQQNRPSKQKYDLKRARHLVNKLIFIPALFLFLCFLMGCGINRHAIDGGEKKEGHPLLGDYFTNSIGMEFKRIPVGTFFMGSPVGEKNRNPDEGIRLVEIRNPFYLGIYEVTQAQWRTVMGNNPSYFIGDDRPVEQVSWNDVSAFIDQLNAIEETDKYRLPTEAEWEYACRSGTAGPFSFGNCLSTTEANYNGNYPYSGCMKGEYWGETLPVGSLRANAFGLYDMHGNVLEWCQDRYDKSAYHFNPSPSFRNPTKGMKRIIRGGGWYLPAYLCRSAHRDIYGQEYGCDAIGFRILRIP
jgi:formylglycine-generating enzyme required for sulfatase activity